MSFCIWLLIVFSCATFLAVRRASIATISITLSACWLLLLFVDVAWFALILLWLGLIAILAPLNLPELRRSYFSGPILAAFKKQLPSISATEQEAMDAGNVWWDADLFSGHPNWSKLLGYTPAKLSEEEQAFLDGPVNELCDQLDDWEITHHRGDLPPEIWAFIKAQGFLGMIIPKSYGGKEFSAYAHSCVVVKVASRSTTAAVSIMVPNSLGPAKLLLHYGTDEQKQHLLPRLACGDEIPCFALTSPDAGSDAAAMTDYGIVTHGSYAGKDNVLGIRLNWEKRYITLGPIATLIGLAFKLYDPDHLLGKQDSLGITLALIPAATPGVHIGRRHLPLNLAFQNGPNQGTDVFIPLSSIIGGPERIGQGWRMLMECLAEGRSLSLPALSTGSGKLTCCAVGAYARVRKQFKTPIGKFEGVAEALARIGGNAYAMEATRCLTISALDAGEKPSVISAISKYHLTERMRQVVNDGMDIVGGAGICLGPRNFMGRIYQALPVSITVEGANILTRSLIIFGQGAVRCHPYILKELKAAQIKDPKLAVEAFDEAFVSHVGYLLSNAARSTVLGITGARLATSPVADSTAHYFQKLSRMSAAFALVSDAAMISLGSALKRKEMISARLGDVLSLLYISSASLKYFHDRNAPQEDLPLLRWACDDALFRIQTQLDAVLTNLPQRGLALALRLMVFPLGKRFRPPSDVLTHQIAQILTSPNAAREKLCEGLYIADSPHDAIGRIHHAWHQVIAAEPIEKRLHARLKAANTPIDHAPDKDPIDEWLAGGYLEPDEAEILRNAQLARREAIMVDDFPSDFGREE